MNIDNYKADSPTDTENSKFIHHLKISGKDPKNNHVWYFDDDEGGHLPDIRENLETIAHDFMNGNLKKINKLFELLNCPTFQLVDVFFSEAFLSSLTSAFQYCLTNKLSHESYCLICFVNRLLSSESLQDNIIFMESLSSLLIQCIQSKTMVVESLSLLMHYTKNYDCIHILINHDLIQTLIYLLKKCPDGIFISITRILKNILETLPSDEYILFENIFEPYFNQFSQSPNMFLESTMSIVAIALLNHDLYEKIKGMNIFPKLFSNNAIYRREYATYTFAIYSHIIHWNDIESLDIPNIFRTCARLIEIDSLFRYYTDHWPAMCNFFRAAMESKSELFLRTGLLPVLIKRIDQMHIIEKYEILSCISVYVLCESPENIQILISNRGFDIIIDYMSVTPYPYITNMIDAFKKIIELNLIQLDENLLNIIHQTIENLNSDRVEHYEDDIQKLQNILNENDLFLNN
ncbi:hypothetical protein TRFO_18014 [Tritrichomonas foetus]|uniref:Uncharacterized protein n=1 Tax=Tritrichomonas foetus TaxID=1144522 RepID=A0A1J4KS52_9EUKA|nr:hypothetical protein TRFO_18014 [Tritrichomonas foetus]|eukprot:OHT12301.1 hypothetical protein TRFO_18014 [Tritrichomonas foetus]